MFLTGPTGCGKSVVLHMIWERLGKKGKKVHVIAWTARTAAAIYGETLWNYAAWSLIAAKNAQKTAEDRDRRRIIRIPDVLIIEEVNVIESLMLERLSADMRAASAENTRKPFGGVQVITCGDVSSTSYTKIPLI